MKNRISRVENILTALMKEHEDEPSVKMSRYGVHETAFDGFPKMPNVSTEQDRDNGAHILVTILVFISGGVVVLMFVSLMVRNKCCTRPTCDQDSQEGPDATQDQQVGQVIQDHQEDPEIDEVYQDEPEVDEVDHMYEEIIETDL